MEDCKSALRHPIARGSIRTWRTQYPDQDEKGEGNLSKTGWCVKIKAWNEKGMGKYLCQRLYTALRILTLFGKLKMNYARYSKEAMDALPPDSAELKRRIVELRVDVQLELHVSIAAKFREIVENLNSCGHDLAETSRSKAGEIDYAQGEKPCSFYLCCDTTISAGCRGTSECDAPLEDEEWWKREWAMVEKWEEEWLQRKAMSAEPAEGDSGITSQMPIGRRLPDVPEPGGSA